MSETTHTPTSSVIMHRKSHGRRCRIALCRPRGASPSSAAIGSGTSGLDRAIGSAGVILNWAEARRWLSSPRNWIAGTRSDGHIRSGDISP